MDKITDRILWSVLILALGVSLFVFGKPALVNLTNQVLHHDDLKATMQTPSLTPLGLSHVSAVNNDIGVSKHAYILSSRQGISDSNAWGPNAREIFFPSEVQDTPIPYGSYLKAIIKVKVNKPVIVAADINNRSSGGVSEWNGNDNDDISARLFMIDGENTNFGNIELTPGTWHTLEIEYDNSAAKNTSKVALYDWSCLVFGNQNDCNVSMQTKDAVFAVDAIKYR